jgi:putative salt-induced outer membrane protein YdiY
MKNRFGLGIVGGNVSERREVCEVRQGMHLRPMASVLVLTFLAFVGLGAFTVQAEPESRGRIQARRLKPKIRATPTPTPEPNVSAATTEPPPTPTPQPTPKRLEGAVEGSMVLTSGNTRTQTLGLTAETTYRPAPWEHHGRMSYFNNSESGAVVGEKLTLELRGGRSISERKDLFVDVYYLANRFAGFDHQLTPEVGTGYEWILSDPVQLRTEAAIGYNFEDRTDGTFNNYPIGRLGVLFAWALSERSEFRHETSILPSLSRLEAWRLRSETSIAAGLTTTLALKITYRFEFNNDPVEGKSPEDTTTFASVVAKF